MSAALARRFGTAVPDHFGDPARRLVLVPDVPPPSPSPAEGASVIRLFGPDDRTTAPLLRLTRRGVVVLALAMALLAGLVVLVAAWSAPTPPQATAPSRVTVQPGDTLWDIAGRVAPQADPRAEVATLQRLNGLGDSTVRPGQVLRTR